MQNVIYIHDLSANRPLPTSIASALYQHLQAQCQHEQSSHQGMRLSLNTPIKNYLRHDSCKSQPVNNWHTKTNVKGNYSQILLNIIYAPTAIFSVLPTSFGTHLITKPTIILYFVFRV